MLISEISKSFRGESILQNLNVQLDTSNISAVVAPNGSGKSTLMKLIIGALFLDSGSIKRNKNIGSISFLSENSSLPDTFTVQEILNMEGYLYGLTNAEIWNTEAIEKFDIKDIKLKKCKNLSKGMSQKVAIAKSMIGSPDFLIMDEPFEGLDAITRNVLVELLNTRKIEKKGTFISTHILYEIETFCDEIIFLKEGKVLLKLKNDLNDLVLFKKNDLLPALKFQSLYEQDNFIIFSKESNGSMNEDYENKNQFVNQNVINEAYKLIYDKIF